MKEEIIHPKRIYKHKKRLFSKIISALIFAIIAIAGFVFGSIMLLLVGLIVIVILVFFLILLLFARRKTVRVIKRS